MAGHCGGGKEQVRVVVEKLREKESEKAQQDNKCKLDGDCEIDEHGIRSFHVSTTNPHYKHLAPKLKKGEAMPK